MHKDIKKQIAERIKTALKEKNITKGEFAKRAGFNPCMVSKYISGNHNFTIKTIFKIEQVLEIQIINIIKSS